MRTEWHHIIPISIGGIHFLQDGTVLNSNLVSLPVEEHKLLHRTLDIDYKLIREFRKRNEWKISKDKVFYDMLHGLQTCYFSRLGYLPEHIVKAHAESLQAQCIVLKNVFNYKKELFLTAEFSTELEKARFYIAIYQDIFNQRSTQFHK